MDCTLIYSGHGQTGLPRCQTVPWKAVARNFTNLAKELKLCARIAPISSLNSLSGPRNALLARDKKQSLFSRLTCDRTLDLVPTVRTLCRRILIVWYNQPGRNQNLNLDLFRFFTVSGHPRTLLAKNGILFWTQEGYHLTKEMARL